MTEQHQQAPEPSAARDTAAREPLLLVLATRNKNKLRELTSILSDLPVRVESIASFPGAPDVEETGATMAENALLKARAAARHTGLWAMADDSGLEVDALDGRPGVYSARFAGPGATDADNNAKLLRLLEGVPDPRRTARFRCAIALVSPDGDEYVDEGVCEGVVAREPRGEGGFGYDPLFIVPEYGCTFAELPPEVKDRISHRARALAAAKRRLARLLGAG